MTEKKFYRHETEGKAKWMFLRNHFRNMANAPLDVKFKNKSDPPGKTGFPLLLAEKNDLYNHPYDIYIDPKTNSEIWVIGRHAHCHVGKDLGVYDEGIVLYCEPEHEKDLAGRISRLGSF
jgi:hypothetical protein